MTFNNLIQMIVKIREIGLFTGATPGSSLLIDKIIFLIAVFPLNLASCVASRNYRETMTQPCKSL